jgi:H+/Cl- antiporter ClcA
LGRFIRNLEYLYKWLLLGIIIGVVAGLGAVVFYLALRYTSSFLLGYVAGYHMPTPLVKGGRPGSSVLAASIIYREDFEYATPYPGFVTSATAYAAFGSFLGFDPMFGYVDDEYRFEHAWSLLWFVVLGIVAATASSNRKSCHSARMS